MGWATRFLAAVCFFAAGVLFVPEAIGSPSGAGAVTAAKLAHVLSFATSWGAALWATFIGGIIMFK